MKDFRLKDELFSTDKCDFGNQWLKKVEKRRKTKGIDKRPQGSAWRRLTTYCGAPHTRAAVLLRDQEAPPGASATWVVVLDAHMSRRSTLVGEFLSIFQGFSSIKMQFCIRVRDAFQILILWRDILFSELFMFSVSVFQCYVC